MYKKLCVLALAALALVVIVLPVAAQPFVHEFPQNFINHINESYGGVPVHGTIFTENGTPTIAIILGERALPHDVVGATLLGFKIGTHLYYWRAPDVDGSLLGDRYARKVWIEDWSVIYDRYDLLDQSDPLDGTGNLILFSNATPTLETPFEEIYCVDPDVNYWIVPQYFFFDPAQPGIPDNGTLKFMVGYKVSATEMDTAKLNGMVVLSDTLLNLYAGIDNDGDGSIDEDEIDGVDNDGDGATDEDPSAIPRDMDYYYDFINIDDDGDGSIDEDPVDGVDNDGDGATDEDDINPFTDRDAKGGTPLLGGRIEWKHMGLQFSWPPTPQYLQLDVDYFIDWLGYTIMVESITTYDLDGNGVPDHVNVEFVIKDASGMVIDTFDTYDPIANLATLDTDPLTWQRYWYAFDGPSVLKVELDIDRDGDTEAVLSYFYVEIWDVDWDHDLVRCQFFSTNFVPPIVFEGWVNDPAGGADLEDF
ncbi:MAG: hypothetical protein DRO05_08865, partial [Thermoproteota archaeon]